MTIYTGQGTNIIFVQIDQTFTNGYVIVVGQTNCGPTIPDSFYVDILPPTPNFTASSQCGLFDQTITYTVTNYSGVYYDWTAPFGAVILQGQGTNTVEIKFSQSFSGGLVEVYAENSCGVSQSSQLTVEATPPMPSTINGPTTVCNANIQMYWVPSTPRADYFIWGLPSGASIIGDPTNDTIYVQFSNFTSGNLTVMSANNCGSSSMRSISLSATTLPAPTAIFGQTNVCNAIGGSPVNYTTPVVSGITNYIWTAPAGASIVSGQGTTSVNIQYPVGFTGGVLSLAHSNGCAISPQRTLNIISSQSTTVGNISGPTAVCSFTSGQSATYSIPTVSGASSYNWSAPLGAVITNNGTNTVQIAYPSGFNMGTVSVTVVFNCGPNAVRTINVSALPQFADIVGQQCITPGQSNSYTINGGVGATTFNWSVSGSASIVSGQGSSTITVNFGANFNSGSLILSPSSSCGAADSDTFNIGVSALIVDSISGPATICPGDTVRYHINNYTGIDYLIWNFPSGIVILNSNTADTVVAIVNPSFGGGAMSVQSVNGCGSSPMRYKNINLCSNPLREQVEESSQGADPETILTLSSDEINEDEEGNFDKPNFNVYPNPGQGIIQINIFGATGNLFEVSVQNTLGQIVFNKNLSAIAEMNLEHLLPGIYSVCIKMKDGVILTKPLIIK
jgi:hypothetical protein